MASLGDCFDNALRESFFATLECALLDRVSSKTQVAARRAVLAFSKGFHNPRRRHSSIGYPSPTAYARRYHPTRANESTQPSTQTG